MFENLMFCKFGYDNFTKLLSIFIPFLINVKTITVTTKVKAKKYSSSSSDRQKKLQQKTAPSAESFRDKNSNNNNSNGSINSKSSTNKSDNRSKSSSHRYRKYLNRLLMVCYVPATNASLKRLSKLLLFLSWPLTVLMKQTRKAVHAIKQSILLRCLW